MKRKLWRWLAYLALALVLLLAAAIFFLDDIAKIVAERRVADETGMETHIGKFSIGLKSSIIHIENFVLKNPPQFGGGTFVNMPELFVEYDRDAMRAGKLHLKVVRLDIAEIEVVENKNGKKNVDELQKHQARRKRRKTHSTNESGIIFDRLDSLDVTIGTAKFTSLRNPEENIAQNLGIHREHFSNLRTDLDFQTAAALLTLKAGFSFLLNGDLINPAKFLLHGSRAGKKSKAILEDVTNPSLKKPESTNP